MGHKLLEIHALAPHLLFHAVADNPLFHDYFNLTRMGHCLRGAILNILDHINLFRESLADSRNKPCHAPDERFFSSLPEWKRYHTKRKPLPLSDSLLGLNVSHPHRRLIRRLEFYQKLRFVDFNA